MKIRASKIVKLLSTVSQRQAVESVCPRLVLRFFLSIFLIGLLAIGSVSFAASEYKETPLKVTKSDIVDFDLIMKNDPRSVSKEQFEVRQRNYWAGQMAHKDRLMQYMLDLKDNKKFAEKFPEESKIVKQYFPELLKLTGEHDRRKFHEEIRAANELMVKAQGINMRDALAGKDPRLPPHKAKRIGQLMKDSVDDYNSGEAKGVKLVTEEIKDSLKKRGLPEQEIQRIIDVLNVQVEVKDYYDTGAMRSKEFGKPLQGAREWINTLEKKENAFDLSTERQIKLHEYRKAFAEFADDWHPVGKNPNKYATADTYLKIQTKDFKSDYLKHFEKKEQRLISQASTGAPRFSFKTSGASARAAGVDASEKVKARVVGAVNATGNFAKKHAKTAAKIVGVGAAGGAVVTVAQAAVTKESNPSPVEGVLSTIVGGFGNLASCASQKCGAFFQDCRIKLSLCDDNCKKQLQKCEDFKLPGQVNECVENVASKIDKQSKEKASLKMDEKALSKSFPTPESVLDSDYFEKVCVTPFLKLPLAEQTEIRGGDKDFNALLSKYAPLVTNLTCYKKEGKSMNVHVELHNHEAPQKGIVQGIAELNKTVEPEINLFRQRLVIGKTGKVDRSERIFDLSKDEPNVTDQLQFGNNQAQMLQHCSPLQWAYPGKCRAFEMEDIRDLGLYNFRDDRRAVPFYNTIGSLEGRVPFDAVRWARANSQLVERQVEQVQNCCNDKTCQKYYSDKVAAFHETAMRNRAQFGRAQSPKNIKLTSKGADSNP